MGYVRSAARKGGAIGLGTGGAGLAAASGVTALLGASKIGWNEVATALEESARGAQEIEQLTIGTDYEEDELQEINWSDEISKNYIGAAGYGIAATGLFLGSVGLTKKSGQYW